MSQANPSDLRDVVADAAEADSDRDGGRRNLHGRSLARTVVLGAIVFAVAADVALLSRVAGLGGFFAIMALVAVLARTGAFASVTAHVVGISALAPASLFVLRSNAWILWAAAVAVFAALAVAVSMSSHDSWRSISPVAVIGRVVSTSAQILIAPTLIGTVLSATAGDGNGRWRRRWAAILRGLVLAVPLALVLGLLFASADAVFASMFDLSIDAGLVTWHLLAIAAGVMIALGFFASAARSTSLAADEPQLQIGHVEAVTVLGSLVAVYGVYAWVRVLVATRGADYVLDQAGVTFAGYSRSGFFQLLWAAAITLAVLLMLRSAVGPGGARLRTVFDALSVIAAMLTLVVIHTALSRLALYEDAYGLTLLRLTSMRFAQWLAVVFVLVALSFLVARRSRWLPAALMAWSLVGLVAFGVSNPEQAVVQHNAARAEAGRIDTLDVLYLLELTDDATPALVDLATALDESGARHRLAQSLCVEADRPEPTRWNLSAMRAAGALDSFCR